MSADGITHEIGALYNSGAISQIVSGCFLHPHWTSSILVKNTTLCFYTHSQPPPVENAQLPNSLGGHLNESDETHFNFVVDLGVPILSITPVVSKLKHFSSTIQTQNRWKQILSGVTGFPIQSIPEWNAKGYTMPEIDSFILPVPRAAYFSAFLGQHDLALCLSNMRVYHLMTTPQQLAALENDGSGNSPSLSTSEPIALSCLDSFFVVTLSHDAIWWSCLRYIPSCHESPSNYEPNPFIKMDSKRQGCEGNLADKFHLHVIATRRYPLCKMQWLPQSFSPFLRAFQRKDASMASAFQIQVDQTSSCAFISLGNGVFDTIQLSPFGIPCDYTTHTSISPFFQAQHHSEMTNTATQESDNNSLASSPMSPPTYIQLAHTPISWCLLNIAVPFSVQRSFNDNNTTPSYLDTILSRYTTSPTTARPTIVPNRENPDTYLQDEDIVLLCYIYRNPSQKISFLSTYTLSGMIFSSYSLSLLSNETAQHRQFRSNIQRQIKQLYITKRESRNNNNNNNNNIPTKFPLPNIIFIQGPWPDILIDSSCTAVFSHSAHPFGSSLFSSIPNCSNVNASRWFSGVFLTSATACVSIVISLNKWYDIILAITSKTPSLINIPAATQTSNWRKSTTSPEEDTIIQYIQTFRQQFVNIPFSIDDFVVDIVSRVVLTSFNAACSVSTNQHTVSQLASPSEISVCIPIPQAAASKLFSQLAQLACPVGGTTFTSSSSELLASFRAYLLGDVDGRLDLVIFQVVSWETRPRSIHNPILEQYSVQPFESYFYNPQLLIHDTSPKTKGGWLISDDTPFLVVLSSSKTSHVHHGIFPIGYANAIASLTVLSSASIILGSISGHSLFANLSVQHSPSNLEPTLSSIILTPTASFFSHGAFTQLWEQSAQCEKDVFAQCLDALHKSPSELRHVSIPPILSSPESIHELIQTLPSTNPPALHFLTSCLLLISPTTSIWLRDQIETLQNNHWVYGRGDANSQQIIPLSLIKYPHSASLMSLPIGQFSPTAYLFNNVALRQIMATLTCKADFPSLFVTRYDHLRQASRSTWCVSSSKYESSRLLRLIQGIAQEWRDVCFYDHVPCANFLLLEDSHAAFHISFGYRFVQSSTGFASCSLYVSLIGISPQGQVVVKSPSRGASIDIGKLQPPLHIVPLFRPTEITTVPPKPAPAVSQQPFVQSWPSYNDPVPHFPPPPTHIELDEKIPPYFVSYFLMNFESLLVVTEVISNTNKHAASARASVSISADALISASRKYFQQLSSSEQPTSDSKCSIPISTGTRFKASLEMNTISHVALISSNTISSHFVVIVSIPTSAASHSLFTPDSCPPLGKCLDKIQDLAITLMLFVTAKRKYNTTPQLFDISLQQAFLVPFPVQTLTAVSHPNHNSIHLILSFHHIFTKYFVLSVSQDGSDAKFICERQFVFPSQEQKADKEVAAPVLQTTTTNDKTPLQTRLCALTYQSGSILESYRHPIHDLQSVILFPSNRELLLVSLIVIGSTHCLFDCISLNAPYTHLCSPTPICSVPMAAHPSCRPQLLCIDPHSPLYSSQFESHLEPKSSYYQDSPRAFQLSFMLLFPTLREVGSTRTPPPGFLPSSPTACLTPQSPPKWIILLGIELPPSDPTPIFSINVRPFGSSTMSSNQPDVVNPQYTLFHIPTGYAPSYPQPPVQLVQLANFPPPSLPLQRVTLSPFPFLLAVHSISSHETPRSTVKVQLYSMTPNQLIHSSFTLSPHFTHTGQSPTKVPFAITRDKMNLSAPSIRETINKVAFDPSRNVLACLSSVQPLGSIPLSHPPLFVASHSQLQQTLVHRSHIDPLHIAQRQIFHDPSCATFSHASIVRQPQIDDNQQITQSEPKKSLAFARPSVFDLPPPEGWSSPLSDSSQPQVPSDLNMPEPPRRNALQPIFEAYRQNHNNSRPPPQLNTNRSTLITSAPSLSSLRSKSSPSTPLPPPENVVRFFALGDDFVNATFNSKTSVPPYQQRSLANSHHHHIASLQLLPFEIATAICPLLLSSHVQQPNGYQSFCSPDAIEFPINTTPVPQRTSPHPDNSSQRQATPMYDISCHLTETSTDGFHSPQPDIVFSTASTAGRHALFSSLGGRSALDSTPSSPPPNATPQPPVAPPSVVFAIATTFQSSSSPAEALPALSRILLVRVVPTNKPSPQSQNMPLERDSLAETLSELFAPRHFDIELIGERLFDGMILSITPYLSGLAISINSTIRICNIFNTSAISDHFDQTGQDLAPPTGSQYAFEYELICDPFVQFTAPDVIISCHSENLQLTVVTLSKASYDLTLQAHSLSSQQFIEIAAPLSNEMHDQNDGVTNQLGTEDDIRVQCDNFLQICHPHIVRLSLAQLFDVQSLFNKTSDTIFAIPRFAVQSLPERASMADASASTSQPMTPSVSMDGRFSTWLTDSLSYSPLSHSVGCQTDLSTSLSFSSTDSATLQIEATPASIAFFKAQHLLQMLFAHFPRPDFLPTSLSPTNSLIRIFTKLEQDISNPPQAELRPLFISSLRQEYVLFDHLVKQACEQSSDKTLSSLFHIFSSIGVTSRFSTSPLTQRQSIVSSMLLPSQINRFGLISYHQKLPDQFDSNTFYSLFDPHYAPPQHPLPSSSLLALTQSGSITLISPQPSLSMIHQLVFNIAVISVLCQDDSLPPSQPALVFLPSVIHSHPLQREPVLDPYLHLTPTLFKTFHQLSHYFTRFSMLQKSSEHFFLFFLHSMTKSQQKRVRNLLSEWNQRQNSKI